MRALTRLLKWNNLSKPACRGRCFRWLSGRDTRIKRKKGWLRNSECIKVTMGEGGQGTKSREWPLNKSETNHNSENRWKLCKGLCSLEWKDSSSAREIHRSDESVCGAQMSSGILKWKWKSNNKIDSEVAYNLPHRARKLGRQGEYYCSMGKG